MHAHQCTTEAPSWFLSVGAYIGNEGARVLQYYRQIIMTKIRVALAQIQPSSAPERTSLDDDIVAGDPFPTLKANLEQIEQYVKQAKEAGAEIAVFPEYLQGILNEDRQVSTSPYSN